MRFPDPSLACREPSLAGKRPVISFFMGSPGGREPVTSVQAALFTFLLFYFFTFQSPFCAFIFLLFVANSRLPLLPRLLSSS